MEHLFQIQVMMENIGLENRLPTAEEIAEMQKLVKLDNLNQHKHLDLLEDSLNNIVLDKEEEFEISLQVEKDKLMDKCGGYEQEVKFIMQDILNE
jgi:hypothetical protein